MSRIPFVCGNWKLNHNNAETQAVLAEIVKGAPADGVEIGIAPVMTTLQTAVEAAKGSPVIIAAQNVHYEAKGAFTGEVSVAHLKELGVTHVIIGHSERRQFFGETDDSVQKKVRAAFEGGLVPIACVGETLDERESGQTLEVIGRQVGAILEATEREDVANLVIAYEPVLAIGTGKTATAQQAQEVHAAIRKQVDANFGTSEAAQLRIQYGGSVKAENAAELMAEPDIDGALVGGASLKADSFLAIVEAARAST
jgi:triosephosphate isomerase